jgi:hypothetical protein
VISIYSFLKTQNLPASKTWCQKNGQIDQVTTHSEEDNERNQVGVEGFLHNRMR